MMTAETGCNSNVLCYDIATLERHRLNSSLLVYSDWPVQRNPVIRTILLLCLILVTSVISGIYMGSGFWSLLAFAILVVALRRYFLLHTINLSEAGVSVRCIGIGRQRLWSEFKRVERLHNGIFLAPEKKASRLDSFRGLFIPCGENGDEIAAFADSMIKHKENE